LPPSRPILPEVRLHSIDATTIKFDRSGVVDRLPIGRSSTLDLVEETGYDIDDECDDHGTE
jgi:hypothetical protein